MPRLTSERQLVLSVPHSTLTASNAAAVQRAGSEFADATLILLGHGSSRDTFAGKAVFECAADVRRRGMFAGVNEAFWKQEPGIREVLAGTASTRVFIVPLFVSEGYFSDDVIPRELGFLGSVTHLRVFKHAGQTVFYCRSIGAHPAISRLLLQRAEEVTAKFPFPRAPKPSGTTLIVAGHGTARNANSRTSIDEQAQRLQALSRYAAVHAVFLEEEPRVTACYELSRTRCMVIVPFLIGDGLHVRQDIPLMLGEPQRRVQSRLESGRPAWRNPTERNGKLVWYAASLGASELMTDTILDIVRNTTAQLQAEAVVTRH